MMNPCISVIVCLYNTKPEFFKNALLSLTKQTFKNFEVIVVNDGSDKYLDENKEIFNNLEDDRFIWIDKEHNGKSQALNLGIEKSRGKYIAINDSDDISKPNRLEWQFNFLEENYEDYDFVSNAMIRNFDNVIFPIDSGDKEVEESDLHYRANHPCSMFNKSKVLSKLPFKFCQMYDSMEDAVMNHIMFYYGVKMYYGSNILMEYAYHDTQVHFNNTKGFLKEVTYKLFNNTFNKKHESPNTTCLLVVDKKWNRIELEKTLLNIRLTSNNVDICIIFTYDCDIENDDFIYKYGIKSILKGNYYHCTKNILNICSKNVFFINTPIRFTSHNWDLYLERIVNKPENRNAIVEPLLFDIEKIDDNNYNNESFKNEKKNILYGEKITLLTDELTEELNELYPYSEYINETKIPILSNINVFFTKRESLQKIFNNDVLDNVNLTYGLFNVFVSLLHFYSEWDSFVLKKLDLEVSYVNDNIKEYRKYNKIYYRDKYVFIKAFLHETQYIEIFNIKNKLEGIELPEIKSLNINISDFLKYINNNNSWIF